MSNTFWASSAPVRKSGNAQFVKIYWHFGGIVFHNRRVRRSVRWDDIMDLVTTDQLLTTTRVVRKRLDLTRSVEPEILERCIEIAFQAPTASNAQGWHFILLSDPQKREKLASV
jgi:nitroreductase